MQWVSVERSRGGRIQWTRPVCRSATVRVLTTLALAASLHAQISSEWRRIGNNVIARGLASPASGPVSRVWYSADGKVLYARTAAGRTFSTVDGDRWVESDAEPPARVAGAVANVPARGIAYRADQHVWRSADGGQRWANLTQIGGRSILGGRLNDVAVSPSNPEEVAVAGEHGVWRSVDGGDSWLGLNDGLANLPAARLLSAGPGEVRLLTMDGAEVIWTQGARSAWMPAPDSVFAGERVLLERTAAVSVARAGDAVYAGFADGRVSISSDRGRTWVETPRVDGAGAVVRIYTDGRDPAFALAVTSSTGRARILRTVNRGAFWDDITADLPAGAAYGITADRVTGAVYVASDAGVFYTFTDTRAAAPATAWTRLRNQPSVDVLLDSAGNQLYVASQGTGVYATVAPHRVRDPRVVSAGDGQSRPAAPGALLTVVGAQVRSAQAGEQPASVLAASALESQVQLPWSIAGTGVMVSMTASSGNRIQVGLPVAETAPSVFVDKDGSPLLMDADSGLMLDAGSPAKSRTRIQILASGLGRVTPDWPVGTAAPLQDPPKVVAPVRVLLDREPLDVLRAALAPGYVGLYIIEVQLPAIVNRGPAELYIEAAGNSSNRVQLWLEP